MQFEYAASSALLRFRIDTITTWYDDDDEDDNDEDQ